MTHPAMVRLSYRHQGARLQVLSLNGLESRAGSRCLPYNAHAYRKDLNGAAMKVSALALCAVVAFLCPAAAETCQPSQPQILLWPEGLAITKPETQDRETVVVGEGLIAQRHVTAIKNVSQPTMTIYPAKGHNTGAALLVFPGGGYQILAIDLEGTEVCDWATSIGITCAVLKYRVPQNWWSNERRGQQPVPFLPLQDAERAMGLLRQRASSLGIDPHKIGVVGFSAGGHLVTAISNATKRSYAAVDAADEQSARPDFAIALYPGHLWGGERTAPFDQNDLKLMAFDHVVADAPPTLIVQAEDDPMDDVRNSITYFLALKQAKVPVEIHLFLHG
jgi:acetyl esterase/lipase